MRLLILRYLLIHFAFVLSISTYETKEETRSRRTKRWGMPSFDSPIEETSDNNVEDIQCPPENSTPICSQCLTQMTEELENKICYFEIVAEIKLSRGKKCGEMKVKNKIKMEDIDSHKMLFSMPSDCTGCAALFNKTVTLLTAYDTYDYMSDGWSFDSKTYLVEGKSPIQDCQQLTSNRSLNTIEAPNEWTTTTTTTDTIPTTLATTPTPTTVIPKVLETEGKEKAEIVEKKEEPKERRDIGNGENNGSEGIAQRGYGGQHSQYNSPPNSRGYPTQTYKDGSQHTNRVPHYISQSPLTQNEYNPPGYLNTGYFRAQYLAIPITKSYAFPPTYTPPQLYASPGGYVPQYSNALYASPPSYAPTYVPQPGYVSQYGFAPQPGYASHSPYIPQHAYGYQPVYTSEQRYAYQPTYAPQQIYIPLPPNTLYPSPQSYAFQIEYTSPKQYAPLPTNSSSLLFPIKIMK